MHVEHLIKQKSYEHVVLLLRTDAIIFIGFSLLFGFMLALPVGVYALFATLLPEVFTHPVWYPALVLIGSLYYLSVWLFFFTVFVDYYLDVWLVTNDRVVNILQHGLFARTISELDLYKVQDVTSEVKGFFQTMFNFGDVYIQTAGSVGRFVFHNIPDPHAVRTRIVDLISEDRKFHPTV